VIPFFNHKDFSMSEVTLLGLHRDEISAKMLDCEVWSCNDFFDIYRNRKDVLNSVDMCFQIHEDFVEHYEKGFRNFRGDIVKKYNSMPCSIMVVERVPGLDNQVIYPLRNILINLGYEPGLMTSTLAYMLAYAEYMRFKKINLTGFRMMMRSEHDYQIPSILNLIDRLRANDIDVRIHKEKWEKEWRKNLTIRGVDWSQVDDVDVMYGSWKPSKINYKLGLK
jgi:hypothetical protein